MLSYLLHAYTIFLNKKSRNLYLFSHFWRSLLNHLLYFKVLKYKTNTVRENNIGAPKRRNKFGALKSSIFFLIFRKVEGAIEKSNNLFDSAKNVLGELI